LPSRLSAVGPSVDHDAAHPRLVEELRLTHVNKRNFEPGGDAG
jgi:hypothetical protein